MVYIQWDVIMYVYAFPQNFFQFYFLFVVWFRFNVACVYSFLMCCDSTVDKQLNVCTGVITILDL